MAKSVFKSLVDRLFPPLTPQPVRAVTNARIPRRCPDCYASYEPARHRYCPQCTTRTPEWRYG